MAHPPLIMALPHHYSSISPASLRLVCRAGACGRRPACPSPSEPRLIALTPPICRAGTHGRRPALGHQRCPRQPPRVVGARQDRGRARQAGAVLEAAGRDSRPAHARHRARRLVQDAGTAVLAQFAFCKPCGWGRAHTRQAMRLDGGMAHKHVPCSRMALAHVPCSRMALAHVPCSRMALAHVPCSRMALAHVSCRWTAAQTMCLLCAAAWQVVFLHVCARACPCMATLAPGGM
eukprot:358580-Chlamydomonas_euryale.AAC.5